MAPTDLSPPWEHVCVLNVCAPVCIRVHVCFSVCLCVQVQVYVTFAVCVWDCIGVC